MKAVLERNLGFMGYPDYSVDTDGNVWSFKHSKIKKLTQNLNSYGYPVVRLCVNNITKQFRVSRLVGFAFITNDGCKPCIDHINTDKTDNRACNLRWVTYKENTNNPKTMQHITNCASNRNKGVLQFSKDGILINSFKSMYEAETKTNIKYPNISKCCKGERKKAGGYIWKYKEDSK